MRDFAFGVIFGDAIQFGFDSLGGSHGVGAGLQINPIVMDGLPLKTFTVS